MLHLKRAWCSFLPNLIILRPQCCGKPYNNEQLKEVCGIESCNIWGQGVSFIKQCEGSTLFSLCLSTVWWILLWNKPRPNQSSVYRSDFYSNTKIILGEISTVLEDCWKLMTLISMSPVCVCFDHRLHWLCYDVFESVLKTLQSPRNSSQRTGI